MLLPPYFVAQQRVKSRVKIASPLRSSKLLHSVSVSNCREIERMAAASLRWVLQRHKDVPRAAKLYSEGLGFAVSVFSPRWAELELQPGPLKLALLHSPTSSENLQNGYSSLLSFTVTDISSTVTKLMALGAELDGTIKYEIHGKVAAMRCFDGHMLGLDEPA